MILGKAAANVGAALVTLLYLVLLNAGVFSFGFLSSSSKAVLATAIATTLLFVLGVCLVGSVSPVIYGASIVAVFVAIAFVLAARYSSGNLTGLVVIAIGIFGLLLGTFAATGGFLLRRLGPPAWAAPAMIGLAVGVSVIATAWIWSQRAQQASAIVARVDEIRKAELSYASWRDAFTCNGPDLPGLRPMEWGSDAQLGLREKNRAHVEGHWVYLQCNPASSRPKSMTILTVAPGGMRSEVRLTR